MKRLKKWMAAALLMLLLPLPAAQAKGNIPAILKFTQHMETDLLRPGVAVKCVYPRTANSDVDQQMRALIDQMAAKGKEKLPQSSAYVEVGSSVYRSGSRWMSFLTVARLVRGKKQTYVDFNARVYDMKSGRQAALTDLFSAKSPGWDVLAKEVRRQLTAYFDGTQPSEGKLDQLCQRKALEQAAFTLHPGKLMLHYRADSLYPGKNTLMHVNVYYPAIREHMTDRGRKMTDNSNYKLLALTFDDGPARGRSMNVMNHLRLQGADATFFLIGASMKDNDDVICREHDAGYTVASHNYYHVYEDLTAENVKKWRKDFDRRLNSIIGQKATIMRAPGGRAAMFARAGCGLPLIQWSTATHDAPNGDATAGEIANRARGGAKDGAVILMHDANAVTGGCLDSVLNSLERWGFLCVTVEELFSVYGVPLKANGVYVSCIEQAKAQ